MVAQWDDLLAMNAIFFAKEGSLSDIGYFCETHPKGKIRTLGNIKQTGLILHF